MSVLKLFLSQSRKLQFAREKFAKAIALFGLLFVALTSAALAQTNVTEFPIVRMAPVTPTGITYGPDGAYWFTEFAFDNGALGRIDTVSNVLTEIGLTNNGNAGAFSIVTFGTNLWFTEQGANQIGRMAVTSNYVEFTFTNVNIAPGIITVGPDQKLWFVEYKQNKIATFDPAQQTVTNGPLVNFTEFGPFGSSTRFGSAGTNAEIVGLTTGPDGNLWFTQSSYGAIGKLSPDGHTNTVYYLASSNCQPETITAGPDGALWFTEFNTNKIGRITTNGLVTEFVIPLYSGGPAPEPYGIITGPDNNLWFSELNGNVVGRLTTNGVFDLFPVINLSLPGLPTMLATGADSNIWFGSFSSEGTATTDDGIGRLLVGQSLNLSNVNLVSSGNNFNGLLATFQNSSAVNTVTVNWGDGTFSTLTFSNPATNASTSVTNFAMVSGVPVTNTLTVTNIMPIATNGNNGTYNILANHTFPGFTNAITITIIDAIDDMAVATNLVTTNVVVIPGTLAFHSSSTNLVLSWPSSGFVLQGTTNLGNNSWTNMSGVTSPFTNSASGGPQFFRLKSQ